MGSIKEEHQYIDETKKLELFKKVISILNSNEIFYWMEFGTLLGYVRDNRFIEWDADIDLGTFDLKKTFSLFYEFQRAGLEMEVNYDFTDDMSTFLRLSDDSFHVDIYQFERMTDGAILKCNRYENRQAKLFRTMYNELKKLGHDSRFILKKAVRCSEKRVFIYPTIRIKAVEYYGAKVYIPENPENHLRLMYGSTWMTPTKDDVAGRENILMMEPGRTYYALREK
jgi:phosphorylcholine metabolism protein LicD